MIENNKEKIKTRIKSGIQKNRQIIKDKFNNFFEWVKGADLVLSLIHI